MRRVLLVLLVNDRVRGSRQQNLGVQVVSGSCGAWSGRYATAHEAEEPTTKWVARAILVVAAKSVTVVVGDVLTALKSDASNWLSHLVQRLVFSHQSFNYVLGIDLEGMTTPA